jgi:Icc-related predicted phosphoesterase
VICSTVVFSLALVSLLAIAEEWPEFVEARRGECLGAAGEIETPVEIVTAKRKYELVGHRLVETTKDKDKVLRVGLFGAIKDDREETVAAVRAMIRRFEKKKVDLIIANGDLASDEFEMEAIFPVLAEANVLVVAFIGNTESCGSFNKIAANIAGKSPHFINGNWVRRLELDDGTLLTLPGYHDRKFTHTSGAAVYTEDDMRALERIAKGAKEPLILTSHGPPRMKSKKALDVIYDGDNVGSELMTGFIRDLKIRYGLFGHILEAGGRATDLSGVKKVKQKRWVKALYVNAGSLNPDPWKMLDGSTSRGMGMIVEISDKKARYTVEKNKR